MYVVVRAVPEIQLWRTAYGRSIYLLALFSGTSLVKSTGGSVGAIVGKGDLLRKINFPKYVIVLAVSFSAVINLLSKLHSAGDIYGSQPCPAYAQNAS